MERGDDGGILTCHKLPSRDLGGQILYRAFLLASLPLSKQQGFAEALKPCCIAPEYNAENFISALLY